MALRRQGSREEHIFGVDSPAEAIAMYSLKNHGTTAVGRNWKLFSVLEWIGLDHQRGEVRVRPSLTRGLSRREPMNPTRYHTSFPNRQLNTLRCFHGILVVVLFFTLLRQSHADATISVCDGPSLQAAIQQGGEIRCDCDFTLHLDATLIITRKVTIDATDHTVAISGGDSNRLFSVHPSGSLTLKHLVLTHGASRGVDGATNELQQAKGGAILLTGGELIAIACRFEDNQAIGGSGLYPKVIVGGSGRGGAVFSKGGIVRMDHCVFTNNGTVGGIGAWFWMAGVAGQGGAADGGAIYIESGSLELENSSFLANQSNGGLGGKRDRPYYFAITGEGSGGAVYTTGAEVRVLNCRFENNQTSHNGGAFCQNQGTAWLIDSVLVSNQSYSGNSISQGVPDESLPVHGGTIFNSGDLRMTRCQIIRSAAYGQSAQGRASSDALGGAIFNSGRLFLKQTFLASNLCSGVLTAGAGFSVAPYSSGRGGAIYNDNEAILESCSLIGNSSLGVGACGTLLALPSDAWGGAIYNVGQCNCTNTTIAHNSVVGGVAGSFCDTTVPKGIPHGSALFQNSGSMVLSFCTVAGNQSLDGTNQTSQTNEGAGVRIAGGTAILDNTILSDNGPHKNWYGSVSEIGTSLSSDGTPALLHGILNQEPLLGPLGNWGDSVPVLPLMTGSPAIGAATGPNCPATDQRGFKRPFGSHCDIGAVESYGEFNTNALSLFKTDLGALRLFYSGNPGAKIVIQQSTDLATWSELGTYMVSLQGWLDTTIPISATDALTAFRLLETQESNP